MLATCGFSRSAPCRFLVRAAESSEADDHSLEKSCCAASKAFVSGGLERGFVAHAGRLGHGVGHAGEHALLGREISVAALVPQVRQSLQVLFKRSHLRAAFPEKGLHSRAPHVLPWVLPKRRRATGHTHPEPDARRQLLGRSASVADRVVSVACSPSSLIWLFICSTWRFRNSCWSWTSSFGSLARTSCCAKSKVAWTFISAKSIALPLIARRPDWVASTDDSMAPYKRCASRMYWSTACRAWVSVLSAASRTLCDRSDCPLPLDGLKDSLGCLAIVALLGCLIQVDAGSMNFLAQPSPAVAQ